MAAAVIRSLLVSGAFLMAACANAPQTAASFASTEYSFHLPEIPALLTAPEARARYLATHYWEHFPFADTTLTSKPELTEQEFVNFLQVLKEIPLREAEAAIDTLLNRALAGDSVMYAHFVSIADKYLYDPNSPMRNEDYYRKVLRHILSSPQVSDAYKIRSGYRLELSERNRVGSIASNFTYTLADGSKQPLLSVRSSYVLLFFNNPDCKDCQRVKEYILQSPVLNENPTLVVLSILPDNEVELWKQTSYPRQWINGYNTTLRTGKRYDLRATPCLYLLDKDKRVLIKDGTIEEIERYLTTL